MPARQYLLQALPTALAALNLYSEAGREGYVTLTRSAYAPSSKVEVRSIHQIADKASVLRNSRRASGSGIMLIGGKGQRTR